MHDRRIEGTAEVFGNQGALFMNAMTWWDHSTESIWSQPWGLAIGGPLAGQRLKALPMSLVLWEDWVTERPDTTVMVVPTLVPRPGYGFYDGFVVGIALGEHARSYAFTALREEIVVNDAVGPYPLVLHTNQETRKVSVYVRQVGDQVLTFERTGERMRDRETGSLWDPGRGLAIEGPLKGQGLLEVPSNSSFDWAWLDFYPHSTHYEG